MKKNYYCEVFWFCSFYLFIINKYNCYFGFQEIMGSFKGHALPGSFFLITGLWWALKQTFLYATRRNKSAGAGRLASRATQRRIEIIEGAVILSFSIIGEWLQCLNQYNVMFHYRCRRIKVVKMSLKHFMWNTFGFKNHFSLYRVLNLTEWCEKKKVYC